MLRGMLGHLGCAAKGARHNNAFVPVAALFIALKSFVCIGCASCASRKRHAELLALLWRPPGLVPAVAQPAGS